MSIRFILTLIAVFGVVAIGRHLVRSRAEPPQVTKKPVEEMVKCRQCGVHLPKSEAVRDGDDYFCSAEHRRLTRRP